MPWNMETKPILRPIQSKEQHDKVRSFIYSKICKYYGILKGGKWYKHQPERIREIATIIWYLAIQTDIKINSYRSVSVFTSIKGKLTNYYMEYYDYWLHFS